MKPMLITIVLSSSCQFLGAQDYDGAYGSADAAADGAAFDELVPSASAAPDSGVLPKSYSLSPLPPVGNQSITKSCTAWAIAYMKSHQEALDQGWSPYPASHQFSPAYIWNKLNDGRNIGISVTKGLEIVKERGCATYRTSRWLAQPMNLGGKPTTGGGESEEAEAKNFRIVSWRAVSTLQEVKTAVANEQMVLLVIRTDSGFNSGGFDVFKKEDRKAGQKGWHAIACVGYDDEKSAVKLMNSWGTDWGQDGFCWASYDLLKNINHVMDREDFFARAAFVCIDEVNRVGNSIRAERSLCPVSLELQSEYLQVERGRHRWQWHLQPTKSEDVERIVYKLDPTFKRANIEKAAEPFRLNCHGYGCFMLVADIWLKNGSGPFEVGKWINLTTPPGLPDRLKLTNTSTRAGARRFNWTARVTSEQRADLRFIRYVTYYLHESFPNSVRPRGNYRDGFPLTTEGRGTFELKAVAHLQNGEDIELTHNLEFGE